MARTIVRKSPKSLTNFNEDAIERLCKRLRIILRKGNASAVLGIAWAVNQVYERV